MVHYIEGGSKVDEDNINLGRGVSHSFVVQAS